MKLRTRSTFDLDPPPFDGDDAAMLAWLEQEIDRELEKPSTITHAEMNLFLAKVAWKRGDSSWLRKLYPEIAECISDYRNRSNAEVKLLTKEQFAFDTAKRIRAIWREHYPGR